MQKETEPAPPRTLKEYLEGSKEAINVFRWIFREVVTAESRVWLKRMLMSITIMMILQAIQPAAISYLINGLTDKNGVTVAAAMLTFYACLQVLKLFQRSYERSREYVMGNFLHRIDDVLTVKFFEKSLAQHAQQSHLLSPSTMDKGKWKAFELQRQLLFDGIPTSMNLVLSLVCLLILNYVAGLGMFVILTMYVAWSLYMNSLVAKICLPIERRFKKLGRSRAEKFERVERVKVCGNEEREAREMSIEFGSILNDDRNFWLRFINISSIRSLINATGLAGIMAWGTWLAWKGEMSIGLLFPLFSWAGRVSENIWKLGDVEHQINWSLPPVKAMIEAVSIAPEVLDSESAVDIDPKVPHKVSFEGVTHIYPPESADAESPPAIKNISFEIRPGDKVALLGSSGSGKSTLMKKLLRFDDPTAGKITINGIDLREISAQSWKRGIGYIPQQSQVLDGTIRSNLTYGMTEEEQVAITDEELWGLMKLLQIDFGERLVQGLDTVVGRSGIKLSGGQAQRLMIGAAVIKKPWLLIVDEATSSLDSTTEKLVQQGLESVMGNSSTSALIVAHRLSSVRHLCNKFVVLRAAKDVQPGESQVEAIADSFEELYELSPTFRQLADDQSINIIPQEVRDAELVA